MPATVIYDADCGLCNRVKDAVIALDWLGTLRWLPQQDPEAARYGIAREELKKAVFLVADGGTTHGWEAVKRIAWRLPLTYLLAAAVVRKSPWAGIALAIVFSPLASPAGNGLYDLVARNRYRFPGSTCAVPVWDNRIK
jgi:predicted DCC family thiol-disulfide oxidoreductase YuxK